MVQQNLALLQTLWQRRSLLKCKGLWPLQKLPQIGQFQALAVEGGNLLHDALHPLGKAADSGKVQQELGGGQSLGQGHPDEVGVGAAVAQQGEKGIHHMHPKIHPLPSGQKGLVGAHGTSPHLVQPGSQAEYPNILGIFPLGCHIFGIINGFQAGRPLLPVAIAPALQVLADHKSHCCGEHHQSHHPAVET